jgi:pimeloyl-ACP methyl ester carboxylesterase
MENQIWLRLSFVLIPIVLLLVVSSHSPISAAQGESTSPPFPPPGRLVDVGGWRLHINCTGRAEPSQPTVILESGVGDFSVEWGLVQPGVAQFSRVCSYDRAGDGWSDLGPHPRTMRQIIYELHTLLDKAGVRPPLVLVGHSYGGWLVRLYASSYPADVAGMVLVEPGGDNPWRLLGNGKLVRASDLTAGQPIPPVKTSNPLRISDIPPAALQQMKAAAQENASDPNPPPRNKLPANAQLMRAWTLAQLGHIAAAVNPFEGEELAGFRAERAQKEHPLGNMPLIVLTRGIPEATGPNAKMVEDDHRRDNESLATTSLSGKLIVAQHSGHHVQLDEPELVIKSIREVLAAIKK